MTDRQARPRRQLSPARKDNIVLARLMLAPHGRTVTELTDRLQDDAPWASREAVYASCLRLLNRLLVVRALTPEGYVYSAVAPDPDDPLEHALAEPDAPEPEAGLPALPGREAKPRGAQRWTHELIIAAILRWADAHDGQPPAQSHWNPAMQRNHARKLAAKAVAHLAVVAEYDSDDYPSENTVRCYFGSWNSALAAAGFGELLRSSGNQPRDADLTLVPTTGAASELERLLDVIIGAHHTNDREGMRSALFDLSLTARDLAMRISRAPRE